MGSTLSGGAAVNRCFEQLLNAKLAYGGVGASGMGSYHGKHGFDEFTHKRSVLKQDTVIMKGAAMPDKPPEGMYDIAVKTFITGFLTERQRRLAKSGLVAVGAGMAGVLMRSRL